MRILNAESSLYSDDLYDNYKTVNPLSFFEKLQGIPIVSDRFGLMNQFSTFNLASTHDKTYLLNLKCYSVYNVQEFLNNAVDKRGKEILDKAYNDVKHIYLLWSGGIDSTAVFTSMLKSISEEQKRMFHVVMSPRGIKEYPLFYEKYVQDKFDIIWTNKKNFADVYKEALNKGYVVTGDCGDQIYGSHILETLPYWFSDYRDYLREVWYPNQNIDELIGMFEYAFNEYEMDIQKVHDFIWWMNFSCKWDVVSNSVKYTAKTYGDEIAFFNHKDFEIYALNIPHDIHVSEYREYKKDMKKYIYDFTGDKEYYIQKMKVGSSKTNLSGPKSMSFDILTENKKLVSYPIDEIKDCDYFEALKILNPIMKTILKEDFVMENSYAIE